MMHCSTTNIIHVVRNHVESDVVITVRAQARFYVEQAFKIPTNKIPMSAYL